MSLPNPTWSAGSTFAVGAVIIDGNGNVEQCVAAGISGAAPPIWGTQVGATTQDGTVTWSVVAVLTPPSPPTGASALPPPQFVVDDAGLDPEQVLADMVAAFEAASGRVLYPAQVERLLINLYAYRESVIRALLQWVGQQSLLAYAQYPNLDYLAQLVGVTRLPAQPAVTTLQFTLVAAQTVAVVIPQGTLVGTADGAYQFATSVELTIPAGATQGSVSAAATQPGPGANGYLPGQINVELTPNALVQSVTNIATSSGGSAPETDAHLRARVQLAPNQYSTAGPADSYRFFALGVDPSIIDASVVSPAPGQVTVYVLTGPVVTQPAPSPNNVGIASAALLAKVAAALSADSVRPLTDTVTVSAVTEVDYEIAGTVELYADAPATSTMAAANAAAVQYAIDLASRVQRDIVPEEIIAAIGAVPGVYRVTLTSPSYAQLSAGQWANCTSISLTQTTASEDM